MWVVVVRSSTRRIAVEVLGPFDTKGDAERYTWSMSNPDPSLYYDVHELRQPWLEDGPPDEQQ